MNELITRYLGLKLSSPIIAGSSGLTNSVENIRQIEEAGAGAVVLKSIFEEQIKGEIEKVISENVSEFSYPDAEGYISSYTKQQYIEEYLSLIRQCKDAVSIPVIGSINCVSATEWPTFAKKIEEAGADALELNVFLLPSDPTADPRKMEKVYFNIVENVTNQVSIPIALKISSYFSSLTKTVQELSCTGIKGLVLFNRIFEPDIDIENFEVVSTHLLSGPDELATPLRWVALLSGRVGCDIAASTGVHDGSGVIKQILAGAAAVQVASALYKNGFNAISTMLEEMKQWMARHDFTSIEEFKGKMSYSETENPAVYERVQFMKHYAGLD